MTTATKNYRVGNPRRACDLQKGDVVLLTTPPDGYTNWHATKNLRDSHPVTITDIESVMLGRQRGYRLHGTTEAGAEIASRVFYGQNVLHAPAPR